MYSLVLARYSFLLRVTLYTCVYILQLSLYESIIVVSTEIVPEDGTDDLQSQDSYGTTLPPGGTYALAEGMP